MNTLNLIPQEQKTLLKNSRLYIAFREALTLLLLFGAIIAVMLWLSRYYLEQQLSDLIIQNAASIKSNEATNQKISGLNSKISTIADMQKSFLSNRLLIENISALIPNNTYLTQIKFYRQQSALELTGLAKNRDELIKFKNILEQTAWIKKIDLPMSALINKDNNDFIIRLEIINGQLPNL